jgi:uncharacterized protein (TIGR03790 family)
MTSLRLATASLVLLIWSEVALALGPNDVWILVNKNVPASREVAEYYCLRRGVPLGHILTFDVSTNEDMSRADYNQKLADPLRKLFINRRDKLKVILTTYGIPLRVGPDEPTVAEKLELVRVTEQVAALYKRRDELDALIKMLQAKGNAAGVRKAQLERNQVVASITALESRQRWLSHVDAVACVDSELALIWQPRYELRKWVDNLLYFRVPAPRRLNLPPVIMTCRLDAPNVKIIKRVIDDSIAAEARGLSGNVYVDARGLVYRPAADPDGLGYEAYDESLREMARLYKGTKMPTTLENTLALFAPGSCPDSALYCGWYSHAKYIASNKFVQGAVGYHMASSEAESLRNPATTFWCKCMLVDGVAATLGPVQEPFTLGFPKPAEFFGFLGTGQYTLVESYWLSLRYGSWMMVLVGDPLYRPFAKSPKFKVTDVKPSPAGAK